MDVPTRRLGLLAFVSLVAFIGACFVLCAAAFDWVTSTTVHVGWLGMAILAFGLMFVPFTRVV